MIKASFDILNIICEFLSIQDVSALCQTSKRFKTLLWDKDKFWERQKSRKGIKEKPNEKSWKEFYIENSNCLYICGILNNECPRTNPSIQHYREPTLLKTMVKKVACGNYHMLILDFDNNVYSFGSNDHGQLGIEGVKSTQQPQYLTSLVDDIYCGTEITFIIYKNKELHACGTLRNVWDNSTLKFLMQDVKAVSCGDNHVGILNRENKLYMWGDNQALQCGLLDKRIYQPTFILENIGMVVCGSDYTAIINTNKELYTFGMNYDGVLLNQQEYYKTAKPIYIKDCVSSVSCGFNFLTFTIDDKLYGLGSNQHGQLGPDYSALHSPYHLLSNIKSVVCGRSHTAVITEDDDLFTWGSNEKYQLCNSKVGFYTGIPQFVAKNVKRLACGPWMTCFIVF